MLLPSSPSPPSGLPAPSTMLRSASESVPFWRPIGEDFGLARRQFQRRGLADDNLLTVLFLDRLIDGEHAHILQDGFADEGFVAGLLDLSLRDRITSTWSPGRMNPPAPVSGEISVEIARMPPGSIAAM